MDLLTFTVEITKALANPIAVIVVCILFRKDIVSLVGRVRKGKIGPAEMEFDEAVNDLQFEVAKLPSYSPESFSDEILRLDETTNLRAVIMEAWLNLEAVADKLARKVPDYDPNSSRRGSTYSMNVLHRAGLLTDEQIDLLREVRNLRNRAVHNSDFSPPLESVIEFLRVVKQIEKSILSQTNF